MDRVLETIVALAGMYLFFSLAGMAVVEAISSLLDMRAKNLEKGVVALLEGNTSKVLESPLIQSLARASGRKRGLPSYIPAEMFGAVVVDFLRGSDGERDIVAAARESKIRALQKIAQEVGDDAAALKGKIEAWFDAAMERVSGRYKRSIQWVTRI